MHLNELFILFVISKGIYLYHNYFLILVYIYFCNFKIITVLYLLNGLSLSVKTYVKYIINKNAGY